MEVRGFILVTSNRIRPVKHRDKYTETSTQRQVHRDKYTKQQQQQTDKSDVL